MENDKREHAEFHRRLRFSNLLSLAEDTSVDVFVCDGTDCVTRHIDGRIFDHSVNDDEASLLVDCDGFVMVLDVGNITKVTYAPDEDRFTLRVTDRVADRFQPIITPTEVTDYLADTLLNELTQQAENEHDIDGDDLGAHHYEDDEEGRFQLIDPVAKYIPEDDEDDIDSGYVE